MKNKQCPFRMICNILWECRPSGVGGKETISAECIKESCEWWDEKKNKCCVVNKSSENLLNG